MRKQEEPTDLVQRTSAGCRSRYCVSLLPRTPTAVRLKLPTQEGTSRICRWFPDRLSVSGQITLGTGITTNIQTNLGEIHKLYSVTTRPIQRGHHGDT